MIHGITSEESLKKLRNIMDPIRCKITEIMRDAALKAIGKLDPRSEVAQAVEKAGLETILYEDIRRICEALSFIEIARVLFLVAQLTNAKPCTRETIKEELKMFAEKACAKAEAKGGKLKLPDCCRDILFEL